MWHHFDCFFKRWKNEIHRDTVFQGHENLRWDDNQKLKNKLETLYVTPPSLLTTSPKRKAEEACDGESKTKKPKVDEEKEEKLSKELEEEAKVLWKIKDKLNVVDKSVIVFASLVRGVLKV